jgi:hypothetical protein
MRTSDFLFSLRKNDNLLKYMTESGKRKGRILLTVKVERAGGGRVASSIEEAKVKR